MMRHRLVMIEDKPDDVELTTYFLRREGIRCRIERVDNRRSLEENLSAGAPAAILCDLFLPGFSPKEALSIARRLAPGTPFVFFSGITAGPVVEALRDLGMTPMINKEDYKALARLLQEAFNIVESSNLPASYQNAALCPDA